MTSKLSTRLFIAWSIFATLGVLLSLVHTVISQKLVPGDPASTSLMFLSNYLPEVLERDTVYQNPVNFYPALYLWIRYVFFKLASGDLLLSVQLLFFAMFTLQTSSFCFLFSKLSRDLWLGLMAAIGVSGFIFLPSSMTWGFEELYQVSNRQIFWIFFPALFWFFISNLKSPKRILCLSLLGVLANTHPGEAVNSFLILSFTLWIVQGRKEGALKVLKDIIISGLAFSVCIIPSALRFVGSIKGEVVKKVLSSEEARTILELHTYITDPNFFWLRFLSHPMVLGVSFFLICKHLLENHTDCFKFKPQANPEDLPHPDLPSWERFLLWGLPVSFLVGQTIGLLNTWVYPFLTETFPHHAAIYRSDRFFLFFSFTLFLLFLIRIKHSQLIRPFAKTVILALGFFPMYGSFQLIQISPVPGWLDFSVMTNNMIRSLIFLMVVAYGGKFLLKYNWVNLNQDTFIKKRDPDIKGSKTCFHFSTFWVLATLMLGLGYYAERSVYNNTKFRFKPSNDYIAWQKYFTKSVLSEVVHWTKNNTHPHDLFWFEGNDEFVFKANAFRPAMATDVTSAEKVWFDMGDQAVLDYISLSKKRATLLEQGDWNRVFETCENEKVQYLILLKGRNRPQPAAPLVLKFENEGYAVYETGVPRPEAYLQTSP